MQVMKETNDCRIMPSYSFIIQFCQKVEWLTSLTLTHSLARLFPLEKRSLSETVVSMARCILMHHFTMLIREQE